MASSHEPGTAAASPHEGQTGGALSDCSAPSEKYFAVNRSFKPVQMRA